MLQVRRARLHFVVASRSRHEPVVTQNIELASIFVWPDTVEIGGNELSADQGYVFEAISADGKTYQFCSLSEMERQSWIESVQEHTSVHVVLNQHAILCLQHDWDLAGRRISTHVVSACHLSHML